MSSRKESKLPSSDDTFSSWEHAEHLTTDFERRRTKEAPREEGGLSATSHPSDSTIRAEQAERRIAELEARLTARDSDPHPPRPKKFHHPKPPRPPAKPVTPPSASAIRAEQAEKRLAELEARCAAENPVKGAAGSGAATGGAGLSASAIRAATAERKIAELEARLATAASGSVAASASSGAPASRAPGASTIRAEAAEKRVAELEARLAGGSLSKAPGAGASTLRAEMAERKVKELEAKLKGDGSPPCRYFLEGKCVKGSACLYAHSGVAVDGELNRRLVRKMKAQDEEIARLREFHTVREEMSAQVNKMEKKFRTLLEHANGLDLALCMDLTGSMGSWISSAQDQLCKIVDDIRAEHANVKVRVAFVGYRDHSDTDRLVTTTLSSDVEHVKSVIRAQRASGGGDGPEDVTGGLKACLELDWEAGARAIVLVCDAPCHFPKYHNQSDDARHLQAARALYGSETYIETVVTDIAARGIDLTVIEILPDQTAKMTAILRGVYGRAPKPSDGVARKMSVIPMSGGHNDAAKLGVTMVSAATSSVADSKLRARDSVTLASAAELRGARPRLGGVSSIHHYGPSGARAGRSSAGLSRAGIAASSGGLGLGTLFEGDEDDTDSSLKPTFVPTKSAIAWARLEATAPERARRCSFLFRPGEAIDWEHLDLKCVVQDTTVKIDTGYFAEGAMRTAHTMYDLSIKRRLVAKVYKHDKVRLSERLQTIEQDVKAQVVAKRLAQEYSAHTGAPAAVDFIFTSYYELLDRPANDPLRYVAAEPFVAGEYKKYNNNNGWASTEFSDTAQAFSHFTWQASTTYLMTAATTKILLLYFAILCCFCMQHTLGSLMVVDLQGVNYILTDPQIHTRCDSDSRFGLGNLGKAGMAAFFCTHTCNSICRRMKLAGFDKGKGKTALRADASPSGVTVTAELDASLADKPFDLSCALCGDLYACERKRFLQSARDGRMLYCSDCSDQINGPGKKVKAVCTCGGEFDFSPYWYLMIGMEPPKTCRKCKERAAKHVKRG